MSWLFSRALMEDYANSRSSPGLVEEFSGANSSAGELFAQSNTTPTPQAYCSQDRMTELCRLSRFGITFELLTESLGEELLAWCLGVFRARTSVPQDEAQESAERNPDSGWKWRESSVKYSPDTRLWKTRQYSLLEDSEWFSETWPRWGTLRDGESWERPMSARPIFGRGSGLWPTPTVEGNNNAPKIGTKRGTGLSTAAKSFPTPCATVLDIDSMERLRFSGQTRQAWRDAGEPYKTQTIGSLNPDWVELLMGWPKGWTSLEPLESAEMRGWPDDWEEGVPRVEKGIPARVQRLKAIGNGQVPQCAAMAWGVLTEKTQATSQ